MEKIPSQNMLSVDLSGEMLVPSWPNLVLYTCGDATGPYQYILTWS